MVALRGGARESNMKVTGTGGVGQASGPKGAPAAGGDGFRLPAAPSAAGPAQAAQVSSSAAMMGVEALLTLQDIGGPLERRRRSVARAGKLLDVLDQVKIALLGGELSTADLQRLDRALKEQRAATDDPRLEGLLDEIETRARVELAKLEQARATHAA
jgi:hypothetical protein